MDAHARNIKITTIPIFTELIRRFYRDRSTDVDDHQGDEERGGGRRMDIVAAAVYADAAIPPFYACQRVSR